MKRGILALLVLALLLALPPASADSTSTWTTTADFDGGTYSVSAGNRELNSNTCNLGIAADQVELDSLKGDGFCVDDADADTFKWDLASVNCASRSIASGVLSASITNDAFSECGLFGVATVSGDFDIRIKGSTPVDGTNRQIGICALDSITSTTPCAQNAARQDGVWYRNLVDTILQAFTVTAGVPTQVGTNTNPACEPFWLRIARSGTTITYYYSCNGSVWTQDEQTTFSTAASLQFGFELVNNGLADGTGEFDDFHLAAGTVDAGGFRTSGDWTSPSVAVAGRRVTDITLTHSGLSASLYIDRVELLVGGSAVFTDDTDITSGTSTSIDPDTIVTADPAVRVTLAGTNAGTPVLEAASVTESAPEEETGGYAVRAVFRCTYSPFSGLSCTDHSTIATPSNPIVSRSWTVDGRPAGTARSIAVAPHELAAPDDGSWWVTDGVRVRLHVRTSTGASSTCDTATMDHVGTPCAVVERMDNLPRTISLVAIVAFLAVAGAGSRRRRQRREVGSSPE